MPFYEFLCECGVYFEIGCQKKLSIDEFFCVDCGSPKLKLLLYDEEASFRVHRLIMDIEDISNRLDELYDHLGIPPSESRFNVIEIKEEDPKDN